MSGFDVLDENTPKNIKYVVEAFVEPDPAAVVLKSVLDFQNFIKFTHEEHYKTPDIENPSIFEIYIQYEIDYRKRKIKNPLGIDFLIKNFQKFLKLNHLLLQDEYNKSPLKYKDDNIRMKKIYECFKSVSDGVEYIKNKKSHLRHKMQIVPLGLWTEFNPPITKNSNVVHREEKMQDLMKHHIERAAKQDEDFKRRRQIIQQHEITKRMRNKESNAVVYNGQVNNELIKTKETLLLMKKNTIDITDEELEREYMYYNPKYESDLNIKNENLHDTEEIKEMKKNIIEDIEIGYPRYTKGILEQLGLYDKYGKKMRKNIVSFIKIGNRLTKEHLLDWDIDPKILDELEKLNTSNQNKPEEDEDSDQ